MFFMWDYCKIVLAAKKYSLRAASWKPELTTGQYKVTISKNLESSRRLQSKEL